MPSFAPPRPQAGAPLAGLRRRGLALLIVAAVAASATCPAADAAPVADAATAMDAATLVRSVLERNPGVGAARAAWRAANERARQARSWDDPMLSYAIAPMTIGRRDMDPGQRVMLSQRLPIAGVNRRQGEMAEAEAAASRDDLEQVRRSLAAIAAQTFDDLRQADRGLAINQEQVALLRELKSAAQARAAAGQASLQDPLAAEVDLAEAEHRAIELATDRAIALAQLAGLLHDEQSPTLVPAPALDEGDGAAGDEPPPLPALLQRAIARRPELAAARARVAAANAGLGAARAQRVPDVGVDAAYDSMWSEREQRWMVGVSVAVPLQRGRIAGAIAEADARIAQARFDGERQEDAIRVEVEQAYRRLIESRHLVMLYHDRMLPAARAQLATARAGYGSGRNGFSDLVAAERSVIAMRLMALAAAADRSRGQAALIRAVGGIAGLEHLADAGDHP